MYTCMHNIVCKTEIYSYYLCVYVCVRERREREREKMREKERRQMHSCLDLHMEVRGQCGLAVFVFYLFWGHQSPVRGSGPWTFKDSVSVFPFSIKAWQLQACASVPILLFLLRWGLRSFSCQLADLGISPTSVVILNVSIIRNFYHSYSVKSIDIFALVFSMA